MRIFEIASAEEQLVLWKLISDNIWTAISQQAEAERRQRAQKAAQRKLKPKIGGKRGGRKSLPPPPHITPPPPPKKPPPPQAKTEVGKQAAQQMGGGDKHPQANLTNPHMPNALPTQQMGGGMPQQQPNVANPTQLQQPTHKQLTPQQMRLQRRNSTLLRRNTSV